MRLPSSLLLIRTLVVTLAALSGKSGLAAETPKFVGSPACATCHAEEAQAWIGSHHGWALREPTPQNVLGDFDGARFEHKGNISRFFRKDGHYFVETDGADGK